MAGHCCSDAHCASPSRNPRFRKVLWIALLINAGMFAVEMLGGMKSGSVSLLADAVDFAGDAANYGISLAVLSSGLFWRSRAAMLKGVSMAAFGIFVMGKTLWSYWHGVAPEAVTMGLIAVLALLANLISALLLYAFREGDANMRSVWLCSRNDAISNCAVMLAAAGVFGTGRSWPDLAVALIMAGLALSAGITVVREARQEQLAPVAP